MGDTSASCFSSDPCKYNKTKYNQTIIGKIYRDRIKQYE